jgi:hypothetical protein
MLTFPRRQPLRLRVAGTISPPPPPPTTKNTVVKSVQLALALDWFASRFRPKVVVVLRHPLNILASWKEYGLSFQHLHMEANETVLGRFIRPWGVSTPPLDASPPVRAAWHLGLLMSALEVASSSNRQWQLVWHEDLCIDPIASFKSLFAALELQWTPMAEEYLHGSDRPGRGFETQRLAAEQTRDRWRQTLNSDEVRAMSGVLERFPLSHSNGG